MRQVQKLLQHLSCQSYLFPRSSIILYSSHYYAVAPGFVVRHLSASPVFKTFCPFRSIVFLILVLSLNISCTSSEKPFVVHSSSSFVCMWSYRSFWKLFRIYYARVPGPRRCDLPTFNIFIAVDMYPSCSCTSSRKPAHKEVCGLKKDTEQKQEEKNLVFC